MTKLENTWRLETLHVARQIEVHFGKQTYHFHWKWQLAVKTLIVNDVNKIQNWVEYRFGADATKVEV